MHGATHLGERCEHAFSRGAIPFQIAVMQLVELYVPHCIDTFEATMSFLCLTPRATFHTTLLSCPACRFPCSSLFTVHIKPSRGPAP